MGAPKGNKNAVKGSAPKNRGYRLRVSDITLATLQKIASQEKILISEVIEKSLLNTYPDDFDGKL